jgi:hypothetical protein
VAFDTVKSLILEDEVRPEAIGIVLAARGCLALSIAGLAYPDIRAPWPKDEDKSILVSVTEGGFLDFYVDSLVGDAAHIMIKPDDFDPERHEQFQEFRAFRAFVDDARRLEAIEDPELGEEALLRIGCFEIYCSPEDMRRWAEVWKLWENAHGM